MADFYDTVLTVLKADERFLAEDGTFLRNAVCEAAMKMDERLIRLLLSNAETCAHFFTVIDGVKVFDKTEFAWVVNNRQFLPDSYTRFKNKIGLADERGESIAASGKVELIFPYKDCILEGGQTFEEQKRKEIFYNQALAPDEVDRLLFPKVLSNAVRYAGNGESPAGEFLKGDNLVIKGNNLLSLAVLMKHYEGMVKCIYIDPPYNSGNRNSFGYNDSFNHSTWLSFMKTRLEYARKLLARDGVILIQTDDREQAYLKVLCDEIFGIEQYETTFFVQVRFTNKTLAEDGSLHKVMETVHVYSRNHESFKINKMKEQYPLEKFCWEVRELEKPQTIKAGGRIVDIFKDGQYEIVEVEPHIDGLKETWATGSLIRQGGTAAEFLAKYLIDRKKQDGLKVLYKVHNMGEDGLGFRYILGPRKGDAKRGKFYSGVPLGIKDEVRAGTYAKERPVPNLIYNYLSFEGDFGNCRNEGGVDIEGGKKPERLIKFFLDYFSGEGDLVLDFFGGSGTTAAAAHKMGRRYIVCEQMDRQTAMIVSRLQSVISGEKTGISSDVGWRGGGSFVYCQLAKLNQAVVDEIEAAEDEDVLQEIYDRIMKSGFISCKVNPEAVSAAAEDYAALSLEDKKRFLMEILDKNLLYVNYCDIDDEEFGVSEADKLFTRSFYGEVS